MYENLAQQTRAVKVSTACGGLQLRDCTAHMCTQDGSCTSKARLTQTTPKQVHGTRGFTARIMCGKKSHFDCMNMNLNVFSPASCGINLYINMHGTLGGIRKNGHALYGDPGSVSNALFLNASIRRCEQSEVIRKRTPFLLPGTIHPPYLCQ